MNTRGIKIRMAALLVASFFFFLLPGAWPTSSFAAPSGSLSAVEASDTSEMGVDPLTSALTGSLQGPSLKGLLETIEPFEILGPVAEAEKAAFAQLASDNESSGPPYQNGILRHLAAPLEVTLDAEALEAARRRVGRSRGVLETALDGALTWTTHLRVEDAWQLRVRVSDARLVSSAEIWVYGQDGIPKPSIARKMDAGGELWLPPVDGDSVWIEVRIPENAFEAGESCSFTIDQVMEIVPLDEQGRPQPPFPAVVNLASRTMTGPGIDYVPGELVVKLKSEVGASTAQRLRFHSDAGAQVIAHLEELGVDRIKARGGESTLSLLRRYKRNPVVEYAEPNYIVTTTAVTNDPYFSELYGLSRIHAPGYWEIGAGNSSVVVADIDTGVDRTHPDLVGNLWTKASDPLNGLDDDGNGLIDDRFGWDYVDNDNDPSDCDGHGTHTSGTVAAVGNNGIGVVGVSWRSRIMPLRFLNCTGSGTSTAAAKAIRYAANNGSRISNNSWGSSSYSQVVEDAIAYARTKGMLFVVSAGNNGGSPLYPCTSAQTNVLCVAATDRDDGLAYFSSRSATTVDLGAPGVSILSTVPPGRYAYYSGTSMAAPHVAGGAALLLSTYPELRFTQLKAMIMASVGPVSSLSGRTVSGGRLNVHAAFYTLPDLVLEGLTSTATTVKPGATVPVSHSVRNRGFLQADSTILRYYISRDLYLDGSDVLSPTTRTIASLPIGGVNSATTSVVFPASLAAGFYYVCSKVDDDRRVVETSETNNHACASSRVQVVRPDLVVSGLSTAAVTAKPGTAIVVANSVLNQGTLAAGSSVVAFHLSTNGVYGDADDVASTSTRSITSLAVGSTSSASTSVVIPPAIPAGHYYLCAQADSKNSIVEIDDGNNTACSQQTVRVVPTDLAVTALSTTATTATRGAAISLSSTVTNLGGVSAGQSVVAFRLSTNAVHGDADDLPVAVTRTISSLAGGAVSTAATSLVIPATTPAGSYYACAEADALRQVAESNETNNTRCTTQPFSVLP